MASTDDDAMDSNPFLTRRVRPGAIGFHFPPGISADDLVAKLRANGWRGEIVGPHGTGKSTLLVALEGPLRKAEREIVRVTLRDGQEALPLAANVAEHWSDRTLVVIDGYEQLSLASRSWLQSACESHRSGLLITTHTPAGLLELWRTGLTVELAEQLVAELVAGSSFVVSRAQIEQLLAQHDGNLRSVLFALYDEYERQRLRGS